MVVHCKFAIKSWQRKIYEFDLLMLPREIKSANKQKLLPFKLKFTL